jgi:hypothetical protein
MRKLLLLSLAAVVFSCGSCSKEGDAGPAGATGPVGPAGPAGADGTSGIIYSEWLDVAYDPIVGDYDDDGVEDDTAAYETVIPADKLTSDILTTGEIKVFINIGTADNPVIYPLPYTDLFAGYSINPSFSAQEIYLLATNSFQTFTNTEDGKKYQQYRYILIPGGTAARAGKKVDWNNYNEVKAYLKLKD